MTGEIETNFIIEGNRIWFRPQANKMKKKNNQGWAPKDALLGFYVALRGLPRPLPRPKYGRYIEV
jgi:hypothetical protein